jgi:hypothetical protein
MTACRTPVEFKAELLSPVAFHRVKALHALECMAQSIDGTPLGRSVLDFVSRGIPYYALEDAAYTQWVSQATAHWEKVAAKVAVPA